MDDDENNTRYLTVAKILREEAIRKDDWKVLDEVLQLPQHREQPNGSMYIYCVQYHSIQCLWVGE